jgi:hypothetical protein
MQLIVADAFDLPLGEIGAVLGPLAPALAP